MVDIKTIEYDVELVTEDGTRYLLNDALLRLGWGEQKGELAQRATLSVANFKMGTTYLMSLAKLNCLIFIYAKWNGGDKRLVFEGTIWEWQYASGTQKELTITAYDPLIRLMRSKDFLYYPAGMDTEALITDVCSSWDIPLVYNWHAIMHPKKLFRAQAVGDILIGLLEEVKDKISDGYSVSYKDSKLLINGRGSNSDVYLFSAETVISTNDRLTMDRLVTRVKIIGKEDKDGRAPVEEVVDGRLEFGILQEIVMRDSSRTLDEAYSEALTMIDERGAPVETIRLSAPDLPFLRKGDKVKMNAGNLIGYFFVEGITHDASARTMSMELKLK